MQLNWTWGQYKAAGKHVASYAAGGITMAVAFHFISPGQGTDATQDLNLIVDGLTKVAAGVAGLIAVATPIYTSLRAANNASAQHQAASLVVEANNPGNPEQAKTAQVAIASAVIGANDLMLNGTIAAPAAVALAVPSPKVVTK
jgi:hypothetical protein